MPSRVKGKALVGGGRLQNGPVQRAPLSTALLALWKQAQPNSLGPPAAALHPAAAAASAAVGLCPALGLQRPGAPATGATMGCRLALPPYARRGLGIAAQGPAMAVAARSAVGACLGGTSVAELAGLTARRLA